MPPRFTNPAPKTDSARLASQSFFCTLCSKGYSRHPEYSAHLASYDHQHKQRLKDMKQLSKDPNAASKARREAKREDERAGLISVKVGGSSGAGAAAAGGGFKKGGFKSAFAPVGGSGGGSGEEEKKSGKRNVFGEEEGSDAEEGGVFATVTPPVKSVKVVETADDEGESDTDVEDGGSYYDPRRPTGCHPGCVGLV